MNPSRTTRWCSAGSSTAEHGADAAEQAAREALASAGETEQVDGAELARDAVLALVFASSGHDLAEVARGVRQVLPDVALVGCTTSGEIAGSTSRASSLALMLFGGDGFDVRTASAQGLSADSAGTGQRLAERLYEDEPSAPAAEQDVVLLLSDGLSGDQQAMVTGVYRVTGAAIPLVGGCAGDDLDMVATHQLIGDPAGDATGDRSGDLVLTDAVIGVRLRSDGPIGIGVRHGWERVGEPLVVTGTAPGQVTTLDDEPALDVYLRVLDAPEQARTDPAAFTQFALDHPLGMTGRGQDIVRFVTGADFQTRALNLVSPIPRGVLAWMMTGDSDTVLSATDAACRQALDQLHGRPVRAVVAFDCIARRAVLGESTQNEVDRISERTNGAPTIGFYTYGEIARTAGISGFHNQTLVVLAVS